MAVFIVNIAEHVKEMACAPRRFRPLALAFALAATYLLSACADKVTVKSSNLQNLELVSPAESDQVGASRVKLTGWCPIGSTVKFTYGTGFSASNLTSQACQPCAASEGCDSRINGRGKYELVVQLTGTPGARSLSVELTQQNKLIPVTQVTRNLTYAPLSQSAYLKPSHRRTTNNSQFGYVATGGNPAAIYGDTILVSESFSAYSSLQVHNSATAPAALAGPPNNGVVYVFRHDGTNWAQEAMLTSPRRVDTFVQNFGSAVALYGDVAVIGARSDDMRESGVQAASATLTGDRYEDVSVKVNDPTSGANSGAVFVFRRTGSSWALEATLRAPGGSENENVFGSAVAVSGDRIVAGHYGDDSNHNTITQGAGGSTDRSSSNSGGAFVFDRVGGVWSQVAYLKAANAEVGDQFGYSVAVSGDTVAVSARYEDSNQTTITNGTTASSDNSAANSGAVYVYRVTGSTWAQEAYIKAANAEAGDLFGFHISLDGNTLAVGAYNEDSNDTTITNGATASADNSAANAGAAYVYTRSGATWTQQAFIKAGNSGASDVFGISVSVTGDTLAVGASAEDSNLTSVTNGTGTSGNNGSTNSGALYVYKRTAGSWAQEAYIKSPNSDAGDAFGRNVAAYGNWVFSVGYNEDSNATGVTNGSASADNSYSDTGAGYAFLRTGVNWAFSAYFKTHEYTHYSGFGYSVAADGDTVAIAAYDDDSGDTTITNAATYTPAAVANSAGSVYVFRVTGGTWAQEAVLKAPNAGANDAFGTSLAISGDTIAVGAPEEDSNVTTITNGTTASANNSNAASGAVYVFHRAAATWSQQAYIKASNSEADDTFGTSVAVYGDTLVVGAPAESSNQTTVTNGAGASADNSLAAAGAAYVFTRTGVNWAQTAYLKAPNAGAGDVFGTHVSIYGDIIAVAAIEEDSSFTGVSNGAVVDDDLATNSGAVYMFTRTAGNWAFQSYVKSAEANMYKFSYRAPALYGTQMAIGSAYETADSGYTKGAVYVYELSGGAWTQRARLTPPYNHASIGRFGYDIALYNGYLTTVSLDAVLPAGVSDGTMLTTGNTYYGVRVGYLYKQKSSTNWQLTNVFKPSLEMNYSAINSMKLGNGYVVMGAQWESNDQIGVTNGAPTSGGVSASMGAAYVYTFD